MVISDEDKKILTTATGETDEAILSAYLAFAESEMRYHLYPFSTGEEAIPARYHNRVLEVAIYKLNKRGAEGEISHTEGGVQRQYENPETPADMYRGIHPYVGVPEQ